MSLLNKNLMQISGEASGQDISSQTLFLLGGLTVSDYPLADQVRQYNIANSQIFARILRANGWQFDDKNQADLPIAKTTLKAGQKRYSYVGSASIGLTMRSLRAKDSSGAWHALKPITEQEIKKRYGLDINTFKQTPGIPEFYRMFGNWIELFPASDTEIAGGLEASFDRGMLQIAADATTTVPGFAAEFHAALSVFAALRFCQAYPRGLSSRIPGLTQDWIKYIGDDDKGIIGSIERYYMTRWVDKRPRLQVRVESNK